MAEKSKSSADMAEAERSIRAVMAHGSPADRCSALMDLYWSQSDETRDAFVAVLVARLTLVRPSPSMVEAA